MKLVNVDLVEKRTEVQKDVVREGLVVQVKDRKAALEGRRIGEGREEGPS